MEKMPAFVIYGFKSETAAKKARNILARRGKGDRSCFTIKKWEGSRGEEKKPIVDFLLCFDETVYWKYLHRLGQRVEEIPAEERIKEILIYFGAFVQGMMYRAPKE